MAYIGGKSKKYKHIIKFLNNPFFDDFDYLEPFCGYCHILNKITNKKKLVISDNNSLLITLLTFIKSNINYPIINDITEYKALKKERKNNIKTALAAFTYSYNGKEFGGFTDIVGNRNYSEERKRYYKKLYSNSSFQRAEILEKNYTEYSPKNTLIYCDPPYSNTQAYGNNVFDTLIFWEIMRKWSKNNFVFISEYNAPPDFIEVSSATKYMSMSGKGSTDLRIEKLFTYKDTDLSKLQHEI